MSINFRLSLMCTRYCPLKWVSGLDKPESAATTRAVQHPLLFLTMMIDGWTESIAIPSDPA
jgi:hypothetical protein